MRQRIAWLIGDLRGDYLWEQRRWGSYRLALTICWLFGCTRNTEQGGDCRRCWR